MSLPLARLRRHGKSVVVTDGLEAVHGRQRWPSGSPIPLAFHSCHEAVLYLRFWRSDRWAMRKLREALHQFGWSPVSRFSDDEVIDLLAEHLARGRLVIAAERPAGRRSWRSGTPGGGAQPASAAVAAPPARPPRPAPIPLLPKLEQVRIEGAKVLPEIMQTLEQIDLTMGEIEVAMVSLEPAPAGLPPINEALNEASASITGTLASM